MVSHDGYHNDNTESNHCIIQVTLKNGESYAIDITGAQYGHYDAVIPWDLYVKSRVDRIEKMNPLRNIGECKKRISKKSKGRARTQEEQFAEVFVSAAKSWQVQYGPFEAMLKTKEENFKRKQAGLLDCIEEAVKGHKKEMEVETLPEAEVSEGFNQ